MQQDFRMFYHQRVISSFFMFLTFIIIKHDQNFNENETNKIFQHLVVMQIKYCGAKSLNLIPIKLRNYFFPNSNMNTKKSSQAVIKNLYHTMLNLCRIYIGLPHTLSDLAKIAIYPQMAT